MRHHFILLALILLAVLSSCNVQKKIVYLQDVGSELTLKPATEKSNIHVQAGDKISIQVSSRTPELSNLFNLAVPYRYVGSTNTGSQAQSAFYTVDTAGEIDFPIVGKLPVAGKTREEIAALIKTTLIQEDLLKDAVVTVEFGNLSFSVMGEVNAQGKYAIDKDQVTLLEALSMAKDLTINGNRNNILVLRTQLDGTQTSYRIDLTDSQSLYNSPAFYIRQHDVIYVEPNLQRSRQSNSAMNTFQSPSFWISLTSLACTVILMVQKL